MPIVIHHIKQEPLQCTHKFEQKYSQESSLKLPIYHAPFYVTFLFKPLIAELFELFCLRVVRVHSELLRLHFLIPKEFNGVCKENDYCIKILQEGCFV